MAFGPPLSWKRADGTGEIERLNDGNRFPAAFPPDGTLLVYEIGWQGGDSIDIGMLSLDGTRESTILLGEQFNEQNASLSPDGRWLAYTSDESGLRQVYVRPFPEVDSGRWQISTEGGEWPIWSPAGNELFYRGPTGLMALAYEDDPTFTPGQLIQLFERTIIGGRYVRMAVSPDGQRFLLYTNPVADGVTDAGQTRIIIVENWFEELNRLAPLR